MCNCYGDSQKRLFDHIKAQLPVGAVDLDVELQGYVFGMGGSEGVSHRAACPVAIEYRAPKKAGGMKTVKQKSFLRASFCPFCGEKYDKDEAAA
ncbi:hypothetical protein D9M68_961280 [compost metagenome]